MYKRSKIEDYIHDPDRNSSDGCTVVFCQDERETKAMVLFYNLL